MAKLQEVIEEAGYNYMDEVQNGSSLTEIATEHGYRQCDNCEEWINQCDIELTSGMTGDYDICEPCVINHSSKETVKYALEAAIEAGYEHDV